MFLLRLDFEDSYFAFVAFYISQIFKTGGIPNPDIILIVIPLPYHTTL